MKKIIQQRLADAVSFAIPSLVKREFRIPKIPEKAYAVIGMRRTGKTYFLYQIMKQRLELGEDRSRLVYFNFEDERLSDMTMQDLHWLPDEYFAMFPESRSHTVWFFFDEIQLVPGWEVFVRRIMDSENVNVYVSGSSAKMLSHEIASSMRGRAIDVTIYPYSFREFLKWRNIDIPSSLSKINKQLRSLLENQLVKYLFVGGFPEAQDLADQDRHLLLQGYVNTVIFRDIVERYNVSNIIVLKKLIRHIMQNAACRFTVNKFYNELKSRGIKVGKSTLHEYLEHLEDAFLLYKVPVYTRSERKRMVNPVKTYTIDSGLAAAYSLKREPGIGHLLENCIFMELRRRNANISYLKTASGYETDFAADYPDGSVSAIQVSADISDPATLAREGRALFEAGPMLPGASLVLINLSEEDEIEYNGATISVIPAWKWLLS